MKKKSLLILPVLLLALAACNKEEEVEEPEDDDTVTTEPSGDQEPGGDGGEKEPVVDSRIELYDGPLAGYTDGVYFANDASLTMTNKVADTSGNVTYTLSGTASSMSSKQATEFYKGVAACGDAYVIVTISLEKDEVLSWVSSDAPTVTNTMTYEQCENEGSEDFIIRISGLTPDGTALAGNPFIFTITNEDGESVTHTLNFSGVSKIPARIALGTGTLGSSTFINDASLSIASKAMDTSGNITYTLSGKAGEMTEQQATDFWSGVAAAGNKFIVVTVSLNEGESVSVNSSSSISYDDCGGEENYIVRLTGDSTSGNTSITFTITDSNSGTINHVIDFSALLDASDNAAGEE